MVTVTKHSTKTRREEPHRLQSYNLTNGWSVGALNVVSPRHPEESQDAFWPSDFTGPYQPLNEKATYGDFQPQFNITAEMLQEYGELYVLSDGVSGCADGAAASRLAVTTVAYDYYHNNPSHELKNPARRIDLLRKAVIEADKQLKQWNESYYCYAQEQHPDRSPRRYPYHIAARADFRCPICSTVLVTLQCTLIAIVVQKNKIWAVSVGDSRIFTLNAQGQLNDIIPPQPHQFIGWADFDSDKMIRVAHEAISSTSFLGLCTDGVTDVLERLYTEWSYELVTNIRGKSLFHIVPELVLTWDKRRQKDRSDVTKDDMTLLVLSSPQYREPLPVSEEDGIEKAYHLTLEQLNQYTNIIDLKKSRRPFLTIREKAKLNNRDDIIARCDDWIRALNQIDKLNQWLLSIEGTKEKDLDFHRAFVHAIEKLVALKNVPEFTDNVFTPFVNRILIRLKDHEEWIEDYKKLNKRLPNLKYPARQNEDSKQFKGILRNLNLIVKYSNEISHQLETLSLQIPEEISTFVIQHRSQINDLIDKLGGQDKRNDYTPSNHQGKEQPDVKLLLRQAAEATQEGHWAKAVAYLEECDQNVGIPIYAWQNLREATFDYHNPPKDNDWTVPKLREWLKLAQDVEANQAFFEGLRPDDGYFIEASKWYPDFQEWFGMTQEKRRSLFPEQMLRFEKPYSLLRLRLDSENKKDKWGYNFVPSNLEYTNRPIREAYLQYRAQLIQEDTDRMETHLIHLARLNLTQRINYLIEHEEYKSNIQKQCHRAINIARNLRDENKKLAEHLKRCCTFWDQINESPSNNRQLAKDVTKYFSLDSNVAKCWKDITKDDRDSNKLSNPPSTNVKIRNMVKDKRLLNKDSSLTKISNQNVTDEFDL